MESDTFTSRRESFRQGLVLMFENIASEFQRSMKQKPSGFKKSIIARNKIKSATSKAPTAPVEMVDAKLEDFIN